MCSCEVNESVPGCNRTYDAFHWEVEVLSGCAARRVLRNICAVVR